GQHRGSVAADSACVACRGGAACRSQGCALGGAVLPRTGFGYQRDYVVAPTAKQNRIELNAFWVEVLLGQHIGLINRRAEPRVRVRSRGAGFRCPFVPQPVSEFGRLLFGETLPPNAAFRSQRNVGEDSVSLNDGAHRIGIGVPTGARCNSEETVFWVHNPEILIFVRSDPGDIIA